MMASYVYVPDDEKTIHVFDQMKDKYIVYNLKGEFLEEISLEEKGMGYPLLIKEDYIAARGRSEGIYRFTIADRKLNIRESYLPTDYTEAERFFAFNHLNQRLNKDRALIHFAHDDTVFSLSDKGLKPLFLLKKGEYRMPEEESRKMMSPDSPAFKSSIFAIFLGELPDHYLIQYHFKGTIYQEVWRKSDNQLISRLSNEDGDQATHSVFLPEKLYVFRSIFYRNILRRSYFLLKLLLKKISQMQEKKIILYWFC